MNTLCTGALADLYAGCYYAGCYYAGCYYAGCYGGWFPFTMQNCWPSYARLDAPS